MTFNLLNLPSDLISAILSFVVTSSHEEWITTIQICKATECAAHAPVFLQHCSLVGAFAQRRSDESLLSLFAFVNKCLEHGNRDAKFCYDVAQLVHATHRGEVLHATPLALIEAAEAGSGKARYLLGMFAIFGIGGVSAREGLHYLTGLRVSDTTLRCRRSFHHVLSVMTGFWHYETVKSRLFNHNPVIVGGEHLEGLCECRSPGMDNYRDAIPNFGWESPSERARLAVGHQDICDVCYWVLKADACRVQSFPL